ncbi:uncharacterized protein LOC122345144 [Puntigrus tetrazona]|uniref:uncharacterized protein LOC122345144 n=1 Tax=Puntigrus tetrazona TaxID=1606681 RepID=UPI001C88F4BA|nr:uncharacterized protein LOC122345144 [Puntigrus tetrazona]
MAHATNAEEPRDHFPTTGNKYFILSPGIFKPKEDIIRKAFGHISGQLVHTVEECNVILVLCVIASRAGTDIDAALNELNSHSKSKPAVFVVLHHTFDPEKIVPDSSSYVSRENTLTVDCLFHEDKGLLKCVRNEDAQARICQWLQPQVEQTWWISTQNYIMWALGHLSCFKLWQVDTEISKVSFEPELMLVLLGMSVREKTAVERLILGRQESRCDPAPAPLKKMTVDTEEVDGEQVAVINTHDWFNSWISIEEMKQKIQFCIRLSSHRPYALLLVIPATTSFEEQIKTYDIVFEKSWEKVIIIFTDSDEDQKQDHNLQTKFKFHFLNINETENRSQVSELLKKVKKTVPGNEEQTSFCTLS